MRKMTTLLVLLAVSACSGENAKKEDVAKATAYLRNDPTASSTDGMTFGDPNYWHIECKSDSIVWKTGVQVCSEGGNHPPICQIIVNAGSGCPSLQASSSESR